MFIVDFSSVMEVRVHVVIIVNVSFYGSLVAAHCNMRSSLYRVDVIQ